MKNRITFKIESGYYLKLLTHETKKLLGSTENKMNKDKTDENVPHLEITEVILVHCILINKSYQQNTRVLYTFIFKFYIYIKFIVLKTFHLNFSYTELWFSDKNSKPLKREDKTNIKTFKMGHSSSLVANYSVKPRNRIFVKHY